MTRILIAAALLQALPASAGGAFGVKYIGEGRGTNPATTGEAADCMENCGRIGAIIEETPPAPAPRGDARSESGGSRHPAPTLPRMDAAAPQPHAMPATTLPRADAPAPRRMGGFVSRDPASRRYAAIEASREKLNDAVADTQARRAPETAKPYSLWSSVAQPLEMTSAKVAQTGLDEAESSARTEYERRILGSESSAAAGLPRVESGASSQEAFIPPPAGDIFVSVDLAGVAQEGLKDAVAGLANASGFRMDGRFPPQAASGSAQSARAMSVRGWLPADKLSEAVRTPGVLRVELDRGASRPDYAGGATTALVVGVRIPEGERAGESFRRTVGELAQTARFQWTRTIGFEAVPNSKDVALVVVGELPLARIPKLLEHPSVIKVAPAPLLPTATTPAPQPTRLARFLDYTREHSPLLLALTLLMLLPSVGGFLLRIGQTFIPYQR